MNDFEEARYLAAGIQGAKLVALESDNHIILEDEPAWQVYREELRDFLAPEHEATASGPSGSVDQNRNRAGADGHAAALDQLSAREVEILHLSNVYAKLDLHGKSARTGAVARLLTRA